MIEYKDPQEYKSIRTKVLQLCKQRGVKIKVFREFNGDKEKDIKAEKLFYFKTKEAHKVVKYSEIIYLKKDERKVQIQTTNGRDLFYGKMDDIIATLDMNDFIMPHKSFIINKSRMLEADKYDVILAGSKERIPISKRYRKYVMQAMKEIKLKNNAKAVIGEKEG